jgi:hypothetical protein
MRRLTYGSSLSESSDVGMSTDRSQRRAATVLLMLVGTAACLATICLMPEKAVELGESINFMGNPWAEKVLGKADNSMWLRTKSVEIEPLPAYDPDGGSGLITIISFFLHPYFLYFSGNYPRTDDSKCAHDCLQILFRTFCFC